MKVSIVLIGALFVLGLAIAQEFAPSDLLKTQQNLINQVDQFITGLNSPIFALRTNAQNHYDNSVRTLTESLRRFNINANRIPFPVADVNRGPIQTCLVNIRDTMETVLEFLRKRANAPIYDYSSSTETRIETDLKSHAGQLKAAINSKSDAKCLAAAGVTSRNLNVYYGTYARNVTNCINSLSLKVNRDIILQFNPKHFPALNLLNRFGFSLGSISTQEQIVDFSNSFCNSQTIQELSDVMTSAQQVILLGSTDLNACYNSAQPLIPVTTAYLDTVNKCL